MILAGYGTRELETWKPQLRARSAVESQAERCAAPKLRAVEGVTVPTSRAVAGNGQGSGDGGDPARIPVQRRTRHTASAASSRATSPVPCRAKHFITHGVAQGQC